MIKTKDVEKQKENEAKKEEEAKEEPKKVDDQQSEDSKKPEEEEKKEEPKKEEPKKEEPKKEEEADKTPVPEVETKNDKISCSSVGFFTGEDTKKLRPIVSNNSGICTYLENSCCDKEEFKTIKEWWEGFPGSRKSRQKRRLEASEDIALFTAALIKLHGEISMVASWLIEKSNLPDSAYCKEKSSKFKSHNISSMTNYLEEYEECSEILMKLQPTILCSTCDPKMQKALDLTNHQIALDQKMLKVLNDKCSGLLELNKTKIFPYLLSIEEFVRCDVRTGDVMKNVEELSMTNTNNLRRRLGLWTFLQRMLGSPKAVATNKSENNKTDVTSKNQSGKNYDESPTITEENIGKQINFGAYPNIFLEGNSQFVTHLYDRARKFLKKDQRETPEERMKVKAEMEKEEAAKREENEKDTQEAQLIKERESEAEKKKAIEEKKKAVEEKDEALREVEKHKEAKKESQRELNVSKYGNLKIEERRLIKENPDNFVNHFTSNDKKIMRNSAIQYLSEKPVSAYHGIENRVNRDFKSHSTEESTIHSQRILGQKKQDNLASDLKYKQAQNSNFEKENQQSYHGIENRVNRDFKNHSTDESTKHHQRRLGKQTPKQELSNDQKYKQALNSNFEKENQQSYHGIENRVNRDFKNHSTDESAKHHQRRLGKHTPKQELSNDPMYKKGSNLNFQSESPNSYHGIENRISRDFKDHSVKESTKHNQRRLGKHSPQIQSFDKKEQEKEQQMFEKETPSVKHAIENRINRDFKDHSIEESKKHAQRRLVLRKLGKTSGDKLYRRSLNKDVSKEEGSVNHKIENRLLRNFKNHSLKEDYPYNYMQKNSNYVDLARRAQSIEKNNVTFSTNKDIKTSLSDSLDKPKGIKENRVTRANVESKSADARLKAYTPEEKIAKILGSGIVSQIILLLSLN